MFQAWIPGMALALLISGCSSLPADDESRRILGRVTKMMTVSDAAETPSATPYMLFGAIGGLLYSDARASADAKRTLRKLYYVRTADSQEVAVHADEYFEIGTCVEIQPTRDAQSSRYFAHGAAKVLRSDKC
jgi:hypothetical protein